MTKLTPPSVATPDETSGDRFERLVQLMRTLRSPDGCAWDREQTLETLRPFVLEEAYEVVDAIDRGDPTALCDELGDLLLEAVFVAQICADEGHFTIADAADAINAKLVRRHPHVFGDGVTTGGSTLSPREVKEQWEQIKTRERAGKPTRETLLDGIPESLPALLRAARIGARTANVGFDWDQAGDVLKKVDEEMTELKEAMAAADAVHVEEELGDLLFTVANLARKLRIDPESALRAANNKFTRRFRAVEQRLAATGRSLHDATSDELEREWQAVKRTPPAGSTPDTP
ncbi:MAG TPA: nucleoside triphosphate pyrophosphohydrolase [Acidobacteria bacterium]|nr:nucleoside triphosphate pyrophosphohydrolase [Acidobacteriota bacterium]